MSRYRGSETSPPAMYDTSVSSRGESAASMSSPNLNQRQQASPHQGMPAPHLPRNSPHKEYIPTMQGMQQQYCHKTVSEPGVGSKTGRVEPRIAVDPNVASAVTRYNSNLYDIPKSRSNIATQSETGASDYMSSPLNRLETSDRPTNRPSVGGSRIASPLIPYDEAAAAVNDDGKSSRTPELPSNYDIRDRIRRLQLMKEERVKAAASRRSSSGGRSAFNQRATSDPVVRPSNDDGGYGLGRQQQELSQPMESPQRSATRDLAKIYDSPKLSLESPQQQRVQQGTGRGQSGRMEGLSQSQDPRQYRDRKVQQPERTSYGGRSAQLPPQHQTKSAISDTGKYRQPIHNSTSMDRQRPRSLPPGKRNRQPAFSPGNSNAVGSAQSSKDIEATEMGDIDMSKEVVLRQMQCQDGRVAEIETPSVARVRELRNRLWSPNEHLIVSVRPSFQEDEEDDAIRMTRSGQSDDKTRRKFNRHWLHYNGPEMAGPRGQRTARSMSPRSRQQRSEMYRDHQQAEKQRHSQQSTDVPGSGKNGVATTPTSREQKSMLFKSRYYDAAQRGFSNPSAGVANDATLAQAGKSPESFPKVGNTNGVENSSASPRDRVDRCPADVSGVKSPVDDGMDWVNTGQTSQLPRIASLEQQPEDDPQNSSIAGSSKNEETVASLIAKIGAVRRDDPQAALEQIDAILMAESSRSDTAEGMGVKATEASQGSTQKSSKVGVVQEDFEEKKTESIDRGSSPINDHYFPLGRPTQQTPRSIARRKNDAPHEVTEIEVEDSDDDDSFFDETTVSSMTNPTYASASVKSSGHEGKVKSKVVGGRPRPSNLHLYNNSSTYRRLSPPIEVPESTSDLGTSAQKGEKRLTNERSSLTSGNHESNGKADSATSNRDTPTSNRETPTSKSRQRSPPPGSIEVSVGMKDATPGREVSRPIEQCGSELVRDSAAEDLERKIRRWDQLSTGMTPNSTSQPAEADRLPPRGSSANQDDTTGFASHDRSNNRGKLDGLSPAEKRDHPWDSSFPARLGKVDIKNTSMEGADGIETTVTTKAGQLGKSLSADSAGISPVHRMRMDRIGQEMHQIKEDSPGFSDSNEIAAMTENADDENGRLSPWHHENTKAMADDFDAAWVSLPSSAFFKSRKMHASESSNRNSSFPYGLHDADDEAVDNTAARPPRDGIQRSSSLAQQGTRRDGPSISTDRSRNLESSTFDGYSRTQENSSLDTKGVNKIDLADGSSRNISGKGRGLRGFLRGKGSLSRGSNDNNSASLSGKQSLETANASYNEAMRDFGAHEAVATTIEKPTEDADRGRRSASKSRSPIRGRAKSLDDRRIRNPSIARKFSRLLRVYDTDKNAAK